MARAVSTCVNRAIFFGSYHEFADCPVLFNSTCCVMFNSKSVREVHGKSKVMSVIKIRSSLKKECIFRVDLRIYIQSLIVKWSILAMCCFDFSLRQSVLNTALYSITLTPALSPV